MPSFRQSPFRQSPKQSPKQSSRQTSRQPARFSSLSMYQMQEYLQVLRRPVVWGSAAVLLAAGYFLSPYWSNFNPIAQTRSQSPSTPRQNPLYPPQTADPANLNGFGNMPGLGSSTGQQGSLGQSGISGSTPMPSAGQQSGSLDPFAMPMGAAPGLPTSASSGSNPSGLSNSGAGGTSFIQGSFGTPTLGSSTLGNSTSGNSTSGNSAANPVQSALDRATHSTSTPSTSSTLEAQPSTLTPGTLPSSSAPGTGITTAPTSSTSTAPGTTAAPPLSPVGQPSFQPYTPSTSSSGVPGSAVPPAFRTPANVAPAASSSGFSNFSKPQPLPGDYSSPLNPPYATQPMLPSSRSSNGSNASPTGTRSAQPFSTP